MISIHAPREGGDCNAMLHRAIMSDFNPRPPRGGRQPVANVVVAQLIFQSTPPARGATSIGVHLCLYVGQFQSTPPARGATTQKSLL